MGFASWKDRKAIAQALKCVYRAENADAGLAALEAFEESHWGRKYPAITQSWRRHWEQVRAMPLQSDCPCSSLPRKPALIDPSHTPHLELAVSRNSIAAYQNGGRLRRAYANCYHIL